MAGPARDTFLNVTHCLRQTIRFDSPNAATGVEFKFQIPAGSFHTGTTIQKVAAFNAATTNVVTIGTAGAATSFHDSTAVAPTTVEVKTLPGIGRVAADTTVLLFFSQTGTAATAGEIDVVIHYLPRSS